MKKLTEWTTDVREGGHSILAWSDIERNNIANKLRTIAKEAPPIEASWLRELALAIDNQ